MPIYFTFLFAILYCLPLPYLACLYHYVPISYVATHAVALPRGCRYAYHVPARYALRYGDSVVVAILLHSRCHTIPIDLPMLFGTYGRCRDGILGTTLPRLPCTFFTPCRYVLSRSLRCLGPVADCGCRSVVSFAPFWLVLVTLLHLHTRCRVAFTRAVWSVTLRLRTRVSRVRGLPAITLDRFTHAAVACRVYARCLGAVVRLPHRARSRVCCRCRCVDCTFYPRWVRLPHPAHAFTCVLDADLVSSLPLRVRLRLLPCIAVLFRFVRAVVWVVVMPLLRYASVV